MADYDFDLFVIGAGSGGVRAARMSAGYGARVGIAEESRYGGTCVIRGCVPKKLMVYASQFGEAFEDARGFGWSAADVSFDWATLKKNRDAEIDRLEGIYRRLLENSGVEMFDQRAKLHDPHCVELADGRKITARYILVATGGRPHFPAMSGQEHVIVSDDIFDLEERPDSIVVVGAGYIAVEFAFIFNGLGSQVTLVNRSPTVLKNFDHDLRAHVLEEMHTKGIETRLGHTPDSVSLEDDGKRCLLLDNGEKLYADQILIATGRRPNTAGIGLEDVGLAPGPMQELQVDAYSRTGVESIYAVGDITDRAALTPVAIHEGMCLASTLFNGKPTKPNHVLIPTAVFTQPEIGTIGMSEEAARAEGLPLEIYRTRFRPMVHTLSGREEKMLMKLIVHSETRRVLGVHIIGHAAGEMIQCLGIALKMGATKEDFDATMAVHPTAAEELVTMREPVSN